MASSGQGPHEEGGSHAWLLACVGTMGSRLGLTEGALVHMSLYQVVWQGANLFTSFSLLPQILAMKVGCFWGCVNDVDECDSYVRGRLLLSD